MRNSSPPRLGRAALAIAASVAAAGLAGHAAAPMPQRAFGPGHCGPVDPGYVQAANETGGQVFLLSPSEMVSAAQLATAVERDTPVLLRATGTKAESATSLSLPVDASTRHLVISAMFDDKGGILDILAPGGAAVEESDRVGDTRLNCGRVLTIDRPDAGVWRARLSPTGRFWLIVHAVSDLDLAGVEFVVGGSAVPGGPRKISGQPVVGRPATLRAEMNGPAMRSYEFALLSEEGQSLKNVTLSRIADGAWEGVVDLPAEPFRIAVSGLDPSGMRYQRSSKLPFHAEMVEVRPAAREASLQAGSETRLSFTIHNAGPAARYRITALAGPGLVPRVEPAVLDMDAGAEQQVVVWIRVPAGMEAGTDSDLTVIASSDGPRPTSNSAAMNLRIGQ